jgi:hypothetical protein
MVWPSGFWIGAGMRGVMLGSYWCGNNHRLYNLCCLMDHDEWI